MTWASIVAAPPPLPSTQTSTSSKTFKVGLGSKINPTIPTSPQPENENLCLEVQDLSLSGLVEPEGFLGDDIAAKVKDIALVESTLESTLESIVESAEDTKQAKDQVEIENGEAAGAVAAGTENEVEKVERAEKQALNEYLNPKGDKTIQWCIDHKDEILNLHSSVAWTKVFQKECDGCGRFFKHCMFSISERKARRGYTNCRWCSLDQEICNEAESFTIHHHLHCNRSGKKECGSHWGLNLVRPKKKIESIMEGNGLGDVRGPKVVMRVDRGVSQKEKKRRERRAREMAGL